MVLADGIDYHETLHADFSDCSTALLEGSQLELRSTGVILEVPEGFWANCADRYCPIVMKNGIWLTIIMRTSKPFKNCVAH